MYPIGKPSKRKPYIGTPQSPYPLPTCKGRTSGKGRCFHKTKKKIPLQEPKIAQKCND